LALTLLGRVPEVTLCVDIALVNSLWAERGA